jgi:DnaK suppressor protein
MLSKTFLNKIKGKLLSEKHEILDKTTSIRSPDIDTDGDETDEIQGNILIEINNQLNIRNNIKLAQIDSALKRIEDSTYGVCQDCEEIIPEKRLSHNPYFLTCVACAEEREAEDKQRKRF